MAIVLTNGLFYITTTKSGGIAKTPVLEDAQTFYSVNGAMRKIAKAPGKCKDYYPYDTEDIACRCDIRKNKEKREVFQRQNGK